MASNLLNLSLVLPSLDSPIATGAADITARNLFRLFNALSSGAFGATTLKTGMDGVKASGTVTYTSATGTITTTINGVNVTASAGASDNASASAVVTAINSSANALVAKHVSAARTLTSATGTYSISGADGTVTATIGGTAIAVAAGTLTDAQVATALAVAINANGTTSAKVTAVASGTTVTLTAVDGTTYGGNSGNAITTVAAGTGLTADQATLAGGLTKVTFTAVLPGFAGNAVTLASSAGGGTTTASGARLTGGTETQETFSFA